jgi:hypothetical protein
MTEVKEFVCSWCRTGHHETCLYKYQVEPEFGGQAYECKCDCDKANARIINRGEEQMKTKQKTNHPAGTKIAKKQGKVVPIKPTKTAVEKMNSSVSKAKVKGTKLSEEVIKCSECGGETNPRHKKARSEGLCRTCYRKKNGRK